MPCVCGLLCCLSNGSSLPCAFTSAMTGATEYAHIAPDLSLSLLCNRVLILLFPFISPFCSSHSPRLHAHIRERDGRGHEAKTLRFSFVAIVSHRIVSSHVLLLCPLSPPFCICSSLLFTASDCSHSKHTHTQRLSITAGNVEHQTTRGEHRNDSVRQRDSAPRLILC